MSDTPDIWLRRNEQLGKSAKAFSEQKRKGCYSSTVGLSDEVDAAADVRALSAASYEGRIRSEGSIKIDAP